MLESSGLRTFLLRRIRVALLTIWGVITITFLLLHLSDGNPASTYLRPDIPADLYESIRRQMGLDQPIWQQYAQWTLSFLKGDFGYSYVLQEPVSKVLVSALLNTLRLTVVVYLVQFLLGMALGIQLALIRNRKYDTLVHAAVVAVYSMPGFWLALIAILVFSRQLGWLPAGQMSSYVPLEDGWEQTLNALKHLILPASVLILPLACHTSLLVRASVREILTSPFIRSAKALRLSRRMILTHYTLRNALLPVVTQFGLQFPFLLSGAVLIEYVFSWPGMGRMTINAIFSHDHPLLLAATFVSAVTVVIGNLIADVLYMFVDPRIRHA